MNARTRLALAVLASGLGLAGRAAAQTPLPKENPFGQTGANQPAAAAPTESVEFSGIAVGNKTLVIIYDKVAKKSRIIPVGDTIDGIEVLNYDARREQVSVKIGGEQKLLTLRKSTGAANGPTPAMGAPNPAMNFNLPTPPSSTVVQKIQPPPPTGDPAAATAAPAAPSPTPVTKPEEPAKPISIARQEEEARMLVSDLLEIGMAQRKAYEEKQRQAATAEQTAAATPPASAPVQPTPQPN
ncbi:MAG: hypothetical protein HZA93_07045 [Verrucomicrobia bacterium]|nr:hypothetical protein [Verrucomicrobiota bacterium]